MTHDGDRTVVVHVLRVPHHDLGPDERAALSPAERARADAHHGADDRRRALSAALLLRSAAGALTSRPAADVDVRRRCPACGEGDHGQPLLPGTGWHASVSHAGAWCVVALTRGGPVGVDVEALRPLDVGTVGPLVLAPGETAADAPALLRLWTRKEAVVKATGAGLRTPLTDVHVSAADAPAQLQRCPGVDGGALRDLDAPPAYVAALCVLVPPATALDVRDVVLRTPADAQRVLRAGAGGVSRA